MNLNWFDYSIGICLVIFLIGFAAYTRRFNRSVADFLSANRCAGRYLLAISEGSAGAALIGYVAYFQVYYEVGFTGIWWQFVRWPTAIILTLSGWIIYRYRQTRVLTLAQLFEMRYGKKFRIFTGILGFLSGIINFGIFPAVGVRFLIHFCGLPEYFNLFGINFGTYPTVLVLMITISVYFTLIGGQVSIIVTDFFQGFFSNLAFIILIIFIFMILKWSQVSETLLQVSVNKSMINPFETTSHNNFNPFFFILFIIWEIYTFRTWQGTQGYFSAGLTPHEARMGSILGVWRGQIQLLLGFVLPIAAFIFMHHIDFIDKAAIVSDSLNMINNSEIRSQVTVPIIMREFLPAGMRGLFFAVILAAFISNHDTYLHSWAVLFIQDVLMPFRKKPLTQLTHLRLLRLSVFGVAIFILLWSIFFTQTEHILFYFTITGAIYCGGAGVVLIGALYWKKATSVAAWISMIVGSILATLSIVVKQIYPSFLLDSMEMTCGAAIAASLIFILISLFTCKKDFNMDRLLRRGAYMLGDDQQHASDIKFKFMRRLGITDEFTTMDKLIYFSTVFWMIFWLGVFILGAIISFVFNLSDKIWLYFWAMYTLLILAVAFFVTFWLGINGIKEIRLMFKRLGTMVRDTTDDGRVKVEESLLSAGSKRVTKYNNLTLAELSKSKLTQRGSAANEQDYINYTAEKE